MVSGQFVWLFQVAFALQIIYTELINSFWRTLMPASVSDL